MGQNLGMVPLKPHWYSSRSIGFVHILRNHVLEVTDGTARPETVIVRCCRRQQHPLIRRNPYSRPKAATFPCARMITKYKNVPLLDMKLIYT